LYFGFLQNIAAFILNFFKILRIKSKIKHRNPPSKIKNQISIFQVFLLTLSNDSVK